MAEQEGLDRYRLGENYYDIMLVGLTGQGKSTTADKLLIADPNRRTSTSEDITQQPQASNSSSTPGGAGPQASNSSASTGPEAGSRQRVKLELENISIWLLHEGENEDEMETHLKGLVNCRSKPHPQKEVNKMRDPKNKIFSPTKDCQVFSNDTTKIRILDVPGFQDGGAFKSPPATPTAPAAGNAHNGSGSHSGIYQSSMDIASFHIGITRNIIRIQSALGMRFRRIVYFLPCRGVLERAHFVLKAELQALEHAFGKSIFECMVGVATITRRFSLREESDEEKFPREDVEQCQEYFQSALKDVLNVVDDDRVPKVPIVFISLSETCESVLEKVKGAKVGRDRLELTFNPSTCVNCGLGINSINGERVTCYLSGRPEESFPYCESTCHPAFKQSVIRALLGKTVSRMIARRWPSYKEEFCVACEQAPSERGCKQVKTKHRVWWGKVYTVDHTSTISDPVQPPDEDEGGVVDRAPQQQGTTPSAPVSRQEANGSRMPTSAGNGVARHGREGETAPGLQTAFAEPRLVVGDKQGGGRDVLVQATPPHQGLEGTEERKGT